MVGIEPQPRSLALVKALGALVCVFAFIIGILCAYRRKVISSKNITAFLRSVLQKLLSRPSSLQITPTIVIAERKPAARAATSAQSSKISEADEEPDLTPLEHCYSESGPAVLPAVVEEKLVLTASNSAPVLEQREPAQTTQVLVEAEAGHDGGEEVEISSEDLMPSTCRSTRDMPKRNSVVRGQILLAAAPYRGPPSARTSLEEKEFQAMYEQGFQLVNPSQKKKSSSTILSPTKSRTDTPQNPIDISTNHKNKSSSSSKSAEPQGKAEWHGPSVGFVERLPSSSKLGSFAGFRGPSVRNSQITHSDLHTQVKNIIDQAPQRPKDTLSAKELVEIMKYYLTGYPFRMVCLKNHWVRDDLSTPNISIKSSNSVLRSSGSTTTSAQPSAQHSRHQSTDQPALSVDPLPFSTPQRPQARGLVLSPSEAGPRIALLPAASPSLAPRATASVSTLIASPQAASIVSLTSPISVQTLTPASTKTETKTKPSVWSKLRSVGNRGQNGSREEGDESDPPSMIRSMESKTFFSDHSRVRHCVVVGDGKLFVKSFALFQRYKFMGSSPDLLKLTDKDLENLIFTYEVKRTHKTQLEAAWKSWLVK